jgi:hypothetical protein
MLFEVRPHLSEHEPVGGPGMSQVSSWRSRLRWSSAESRPPLWRDPGGTTVKKTFLIATALTSLATGVRYLGSLARLAPALSAVLGAGR